MKKIEIIEELCTIYLNDPSKRGTSPNTTVCTYLSAEGNKCIAGMTLDPEYAGYRNILHQNEAIDDLLSGGDGSAQLPKYRGHEGAFWRQLQLWHDSGIWTSCNNAIELMRAEYEKLREIYKDNDKFKRIDKWMLS